VLVSETCEAETCEAETVMVLAVSLGLVLCVQGHLSYNINIWLEELWQ